MEKQQLSDKVAIIEQLAKIAQKLIPSINMYASSVSKPTPYTARSLWSQAFTLAMARNDAEMEKLNDPYGGYQRDNEEFMRGQLKVLICFWRNGDQRLNSNYTGGQYVDAIGEGDVVDSLPSAVALVRKYIEDPKMGFDPIPEGLDYSSLNNRFLAQRRNLYRNNTQSTVMSFLFKYDHVRWNLQVTLIRYTREGQARDQQRRDEQEQRSQQLKKYRGGRGRGR